MKYVIVRCEDTAPRRHQGASLLEGAKGAHLKSLAQTGAVGVIRSARHGAPLNRFRLDCGLLGLDPDELENAAGRGYAANAGLTLEAEDAAWCCELVTHHDGVLIDATAGNIPTAESRLLMQALNEQLGSDTRRWVVGENAHHVLVVRDEALKADHPSPQPPHALLGQAWERHLPAGSQGIAVKALLEQATQILEHHSVNRVRLDLGENPANLLWLWGPAAGTARATYGDLTRRKGAVCATAFGLRGLAQALQMTVHHGPASLEERPLERLHHTVGELVARHDLLVVHLQVASPDPMERFCAMERLDQVFLKPLTNLLSSQDARLLVAIDDARTGEVPFVAVGTGLPRHPAAHMEAPEGPGNPFAFPEGRQAFDWFTQGAP